MVGTNPSGKGGIAAVVSVLQQNGFFTRFGGRYVVTHEDGARWVKVKGAFGAFASVLATCLRDRPGVVHVHSASRASFFRKALVLAIARLFGCATVFHLHGGEFTRFATQEAGPLGRWWIRHTLEASSAVIVLSQGWMDFMREFAPKARVRIIANPVRVPAAPDNSREEHGRILFLGQVKKTKGIFDLVSAVALLKAEIPSIRLVIGGVGDMDALQRAIAEGGLNEHVECLGWIGPEERDAQLARAQVFCLPSYVEGLPMSMLEAMAAAKCVVVTPVGGIPEAIQDRGNGMLVPVGEPEALAAALRTVLLDKNLRARIADRARDTVVATYGTDVVIDKLARMYEEII